MPDLTTLENHIDAEYGKLRAVIAKHPMTAFYVALAVGLLLGHFI